MQRELTSGRSTNRVLSFQRAPPRFSVICVTSQHEASNRYAYSTRREGRANLFTFEAAPAKFEAAQPTTSTDSSVIFAPWTQPFAVSNDPSAAPWRAAPAGEPGAAPRPEPRPGLSAKPSTPCARNRCAHLYTKRRLIPTVAAMAVIDTPSATSKIIRARRSSPATDGCPPLPRAERLAFLRREGDGERGFASTSHTAPLCDKGVDRNHMGVPSVIRRKCSARQTATTSPLVARHDCI